MDQKGMQDRLAKDLQDRLIRKQREGGSPAFPLNLGFGLGPWTPGPSSSSEFMSPVGSGSLSGGQPSGGVSGSNESIHLGTSSGAGTSSNPTPSNSFDSQREIASNSPGWRPSDPITHSNPLYNPSSEITLEDPPSPSAVDFRTAEVHHREPLTRPLSASRVKWRSLAEPIDVDPTLVTIIDPDGTVSSYTPVVNDSKPIQRLFHTVGKLWPAPALAQIPAWFEQWWFRAKPGRQPTPLRSAEKGSWDRIRAGEFDKLSLDNMALLQIAAAFVVLLLIFFLAYLWYDNWVQDKRGLVVPAPKGGSPRRSVIYVTKDQYTKGRSRQEGRKRSVHNSPRVKPPETASPETAPPEAALSVIDPATLYEYPPKIF